LSEHVTGNEFLISGRFFSQRRAALNEVSAAVAAAIGKGALDCRRARQAGGHAVPRPHSLPGWHGRYRL